MKKLLQRHYAFLILLVLLTVYHFGTLHLIPFHPDESTQIYMSRDVNLWFRKPLSLVWEPSENGSPQTRLRQLDAPLTRYLIGIGRSLAGLKTIPRNWDWEKSWTENIRQQSYPPQDLLQVARISVTILLPFSLTLFYSYLQRVENRMTGLMGTFLLGMNALVLLHARRAMAEGAIIFGVILFIWALRFRHTYPWLLGIAAAIAYNAKQSTLPILLVGIIAVTWLKEPSRNFAKMGRNLLSYLGPFFLLTFLLNPLLWKHPISASLSRWQARFAFTEDQLAIVLQRAPNQALLGLPKRTLSLVNNLYLNEPSAADVGNYLQHTKGASEGYFRFPGSSFGRGLISGGIYLSLTLVGVIYFLREMSKVSFHRRQYQLLVFTATLCQTGAILIAVPLPWQRYVIPLLPLVTIWMTLGTAPILRGLIDLVQPDSVE